MAAGLGFVAGVVLGSLLVFATRHRTADARRRLYATWLVLAALIYVGFAAVGRARGAWLGYELLGVVVFGALAWIGRRHGRALASGWAAHVLWDVLLHVGNRPGAIYTPQWYPWVCVSFDLLVAAATLGRMPWFPGRR
jgi:hypothetical protein